MTSWSSAARPMRQHAASFERAHHLARGAQFARHRVGRLGLDGGEVDVDLGGEKEVVAPGLVHQRRAGRAAPPACRAPPAGPRTRSRSASRCPPPRRRSARRTWRPARRHGAPCRSASTGCSRRLESGEARCRRGSRATPTRSAAMNTRSRISGGMRIAGMRAWATGLRRNATSRRCGSDDVADELARGRARSGRLPCGQPRANALSGHAFPSAMHRRDRLPVYGRDQRNALAAPAKAGACGVRGGPAVPPPLQPVFGQTFRVPFFYSILDMPVLSTCQPGRARPHRERAASALPWRACRWR